MKIIGRGVKFGDLQKGDRFTYPLMYSLMIKTAKIKDGTDGAFYTAVDVNTGVHFKIKDDTEVYTFLDYDVEYGVEVRPDAVLSHDFIHIIVREEFGVWGEGKDGECHTLINDIEESNGITLGDIVKLYPNVDMLVCENSLYGTVYKYDAYRDGKWRVVGRTMGYA